MFNMLYCKNEFNTRTSTLATKHVGKSNTLANSTHFVYVDLRLQKLATAPIGGCPNLVMKHCATTLCHLAAGCLIGTFRREGGKAGRWDAWSASSKHLLACAAATKTLRIPSRGYQEARTATAVWWIPFPWKTREDKTRQDETGGEKRGHWPRLLVLHILVVHLRQRRTQDLDPS